MSARPSRLFVIQFLKIPRRRSALRIGAHIFLYTNARLPLISALILPGLQVTSRPCHGIQRHGACHSKPTPVC